MPCSDGLPAGRTEYIEVDNPKISAALCALLGNLAERGERVFKQFLSTIDWREAGVTQEYVEDWWKRHKEQDRKRREREAEQRRLKQVKQSALIKAQKHLSYEEQKALGLTK